MDPNILTFIKLCQWDKASFLIYSDNVFGTLIYYSHLLSLIVSLLIGVFVFFRNKTLLPAKLLFFITLSFSVWVFLDLILWATEKPQFTMFFWSVMIFVEPLIYALCLYFVDVFVNQKDVSLKKKFGIFLPLFPIIVFLPTNFVLQGFDLTNCYREAIEGPIAIYYVYFIEIIYVLWIVLFLIREFNKAVKEKRQLILLVMVAISLFLLSFVSGNIIGSLTVNWTLSQIGLFGMPVFVGFLAYIIVRFKTFNIKLIGSQALVFAVGILVLAILFVRNIENVRLIVIFTSFFVAILGYALIKSVKKEVNQREKLEILKTKLEESNLNLEVANEKLKGLDKLKTEFVSLASHQLRSPLTAIKGYTSMLIDGDYGELNPQAKETIQRVMESSNNLTLVVEDLLNVTKIESGGMKFVMESFDLSKVVEDEAKNLSITANRKGLKINFEKDNNTSFITNGDKEKIRQVIINFIDNSIKYTKEGHLDLSINKKDDKLIFCVKDTGMGMTPEIKDSLFQKFVRGDGARMNTSGSGLGLYLAKQIVEAHNGRVWVESDGPNKGSSFYMELNEIK